MKIVLDISSIVYGTGVSVYASELVKHLSLIDKVNEYLLVAGTLRQRQFFEEWFEAANLGDNFHMKLIPVSSRMQTVIWNDWQCLPIEWIVGKFDVYHSLDWSLAPSAYARVLTVHDLFFLKRPDLQQHPYAGSLKRRLELAIKANLEVIAVSEATKQDLMSLLSYPSHLITVIYEASGVSLSKVQDMQFNQLKSRLGIRDKYLVIVATQEPRKNLQRTLEAFSLVKNSATDLVVIGKAGWGEQLGDSTGVISTGYLPDAEMHLLVAGAKGLLYPSLYEGFGLPVLMGFELGVPVLTSNVSSMPEVGGDAVVYVDPMNVHDLARGIEQMMIMEDGERKSMIMKGKQQLARFSWRKTAEETLSVYTKLVSN